MLDFLEAVRLPISHLVLKHYPSGARSLFSSWLEPAGERKRANVAKILDDFRTSQFILIGDSGELDLELYCALLQNVLLRFVESSSATSAHQRLAHPTPPHSPPRRLLTRPRRVPLLCRPNLALGSKSALTQPSPIRRTDAPEIPFFDTSYPPRAPTVLDLPTSNYTGRAAEAVRTSRALSEQEIRQAQIFQTRLNKATSMLLAPPSSDFSRRAATSKTRPVSSFVSYRAAPDPPIVRLLTRFSTSAGAKLSPCHHRFEHDQQSQCLHDPMRAHPQSA